jgi:dGTP triphosphohydrolase
VEAVLNELMAGEGGFNHNEQGLRVVDFLEERYPSFKGLNLSWETREGIIKHSLNVDKDFAAVTQNSILTNSQAWKLRLWMFPMK